MSTLVSLALTNVTREIVDEYLAPFPTKLLRYARDYLYEDRLIRKIAMPERLIAQLRGYNDTYLPHFELSASGPQGGCNCGHSQPCAHFTALLLAFRDHSEQFVFPPYGLYHAVKNIWPLVFEETSLTQFIPDPIPHWMLPQPFVPQASWSPPPLDRVVRQPSLLADVHPSWLTRPDIEETIRHWDTVLMQKAGAVFWIALWAYNPYLPLESVFQVIGSQLPPAQPFILETLWTKRPIALPVERQVLATHRLLTLLGQIPDTPMIWLWNQFPEADPLYLERARLLMNGNQPDKAIRLLESHWPDTKEAQHTVRQAIISWLPVPDQLPYRIADCLDTGSVLELEALQTLLSPEAWHDLAQHFNHRWRPSADA